MNVLLSNRSGLSFDRRSRRISSLVVDADLGTSVSAGGGREILLAEWRL
jgi:hypothetical protein